jgi:hypothetical protein
MMFHADEDVKEHTDKRQTDTAGELRREGGV